MFKKDDYIVCEHGKYDKCFPDKYIFKQREDWSNLRVYLDAKNSDNGWSLIDFEKKGSYGKWRYATQNEIDYYDLIGKPFDTTSDEFLNYKFEPEDLSCLVKILERIKNE